MVNTPVQIPRPVRWSLWLAAGVAVGLVVGFAAGLARPRERRTRSSEPARFSGFTEREA